MIGDQIHTETTDVLVNVSEVLLELTEGETTDALVDVAEVGVDVIEGRK
jgi:hypothetical protein